MFSLERKGLLIKMLHQQVWSASCIFHSFRLQKLVLADIQGTVEHNSRFLFCIMCNTAVAYIDLFFSCVLTNVPNSGFLKGLINTFVIPLYRLQSPNSSTLKYH
jgi:hypothetical protein